MANSLMELYGGGMTGRPTNYQLGGRIARSNLERAVSRETRALKEAQEEAAKKKQKASALGQIGSIAGGAIGSIFGPVGTGIGAALGSQLGQSTYQGTDVGEGRFLTQDRQAVQEGVDEFKEGMLGRSAIAGLQAAIMPEFYKGVGKFAGDLAGGIADKGLGFLRGRFQTPVGELTKGSEIFMKDATAAGVNPFQDAISQLQSATSSVSGPPANPFTKSVIDSATNQGEMSFGQAFRQALDEGGLGSTFTFQGNPYLVEFADRDMGAMSSRRGGGLINMMREFQVGGLVEEEPSPFGNPPVLPTLPSGMGPMPVTPTGGGVGTFDEQGGAGSLALMQTPTNTTATTTTTTGRVGAGSIADTFDQIGGGTSLSAGVGTGDMRNVVVSGGMSGLEKQEGSGSITQGGGSVSDGTVVRGGVDSVVDPGDIQFDATDDSVGGRALLSQREIQGIGGIGPGNLGQVGGYGTAIGAQSALSQLGMQDIANDPRLQQYLSELPQFSQGYRQQFQDIQRGARQNLADLYAQQRMGGTGLGIGTGGQQFQQQLSGLAGDVAQRRRGVVEGFQSDLLSAIGDIERAGQFEFGSI